MMASIAFLFVLGISLVQIFMDKVPADSTTTILLSISFVIGFAPISLMHISSMKQLIRLTKLEIKEIEKKKE
jgi:TRAP-type C4-dicarboxylate transport system permease small subunit